MSEYKLQFRQSFVRCSGENCTHKESCQHFHAREEALDNDLANGENIEAKDCIKNHFSELAFNNEPKVSE